MKDETLSSPLEPALSVVKKTSTAYSVFYQRKDRNPRRVGEFIMDVDGSWLFFFDNQNGGGWPRYVIAELSAWHARLRDA